MLDEGDMSLDDDPNMMDLDMGQAFAAELELMATKEENNKKYMEQKDGPGRRLTANDVTDFRTSDLAETDASNSISDIARILYGSPDLAAF